MGWNTWTLISMYENRALRRSSPTLPKILTENKPFSWKFPLPPSKVSSTVTGRNVDRFLGVNSKRLTLKGICERCIWRLILTEAKTMKGLLKETPSVREHITWQRTKRSSKSMTTSALTPVSTCRTLTSTHLKLRMIESLPLSCSAVLVKVRWIR